MVETGPTSCRDRLRDGVARAGVESREVVGVLVTHIHLDHAGGLGAAAELFPSATLYVHAAGAPHLVDPSRLVSSARRAWGPASDTLWGPVLPSPDRRIVRLSGGESLPLRDGRLRVVATPGHARHHLAFYDEPSEALLTGDAAGVRLRASPAARPAVPPPDLDVEELLASVERMRALRPRRVWYTHFGPRDGAVEALERYTRSVVEWRDAALVAAREEATVAHVAHALRSLADASSAGGATVAASGREELISGTEMAAQGFLRYFETHGALARS